jgi:hypothetical protein
MKALRRFTAVIIASISFLLVSACVTVEQVNCNSVTISFITPDSYIAWNVAIYNDSTGEQLVSQFVELTEDTDLTFTFAQQITGTPLRIVVDSDSMVVPCNGDPITFFNPGDSRVDPRPGDRVIAYCNDNGIIDVWGIKDDSTGYRLTTFAYEDVAAAGSTGLTTFLGGSESVSISADSQDNFWLAWNGGPYGNFAKGFACDYEIVAE